MKLLDEMFCIESDGEHEVTLRLDGNHPIYSSHFPGNPITPGVCIVQMLCELLSCRTGCVLTLSKIVNLKFVHPLSPVECPRISVAFTSVAADDETVRAKGTIEANGQVTTKFSMIFDKTPTATH